MPRGIPEEGDGEEVPLRAPSSVFHVKQSQRPGLAWGG